jgi:hypothetical protein
MLREGEGEGELSVIKKVNYSWGNLIGNSVASTEQSYDHREYKLLKKGKLELYKALRKS